MPNKTTRLCCLLIVLLIELVAIWWFSNMQPYYQEIDTGLSPMARKNPYLAAQQYLNTTGSDVFTTQNLGHEVDISKYQTLFISHAGQVVSKKQTKQLLKWMRKGGHIIVSAQSNSEDDPLLSLFSITKRNIAPNQTEETILRLDEQLTKAEEEKEAVLTELFFDGVEGSVQVELSSSHSLHHPYISDGESAKGNGESSDYTPNYWAYDDNGLQFIQFNYGDGLLSVLSSNVLWDNDSIADYDHAYLLSILTGKNTQLIILYGSQMPSIFTLIWQNSPELSITFLLIISFCLWYFGQRFGPIVEIDDTTRRAFNEHLLASGKYLWRMKKHTEILEVLRKDIFKHLENSDLYQVSADKNDICKALAANCSYVEQEIFNALYCQNSLNEQEFVILTRLLQQLREQL